MAPDWQGNWIILISALLYERSMYIYISNKVRMQVSLLFCFFWRFPDGPLGTAKIQRNALTAKKISENKKMWSHSNSKSFEEGGKKCPSESQRGQQQESVRFLGVLDLFLTWYLYNIPLPFPQSPHTGHALSCRVQCSTCTKGKAEISKVIFQCNDMWYHEMQQYYTENGLAYVSFLALL